MDQGLRPLRNRNSLAGTHGGSLALREDFDGSDKGSTHRIVHYSSCIRRPKEIGVLDFCMSFTLHSRLSHCAGLQQWNYRFDGVNSALPAHQVTVYAGGGHRYVTNTAPDSSFTLAHYLNGQLVTV